MKEDNNTFYVVINGMDLTGKTSLAKNMVQNIEQDVLVLHSAFSSGNPLNILASKLRKEKEIGEYTIETINELFDFATAEDPALLKLLENEFPIISDKAIGHLYADATAKELALFNPTKSIIHDSSTIIKTLTIQRDLGAGSALMQKLETLRKMHPVPTKPEFSILLEASLEAKIDRLNKRIKESGFVSELDKKVLLDPKKVERQTALMKEITLYTFPGTLVFDTTHMTEQEVFDAVRNHLDICKPKRKKL